MKKTTVYIKNHPAAAGYWIYNLGYKSAWEKLGYNVILFNNMLEIKNLKDSIVMTTSSDVDSEEKIKVLKNTKKSFVFVTSEWFPGIHNIYASDIKEELRNNENIVLWTYAQVKEPYSLKKSIGSVIELPLAFDNINYKRMIDNNYNFDVCFVGKLVDNGTNEKPARMRAYLERILKEENIKCGFFGMSNNISHIDECKILTNSKICLNIHDVYQNLYGLDTNERTFKSLGLNGMLVSDYVKQISDLELNVVLNSDIEQYIISIKSYLNFNLEEIKKFNRREIEEKHTYVERVKKLIKLV